VRQAERDAGERPGLTTDERARLKAARTITDWVNGLRLILPEGDPIVRICNDLGILCFVSILESTYQVRYTTEQGDGRRVHGIASRVLLDGVKRSGDGLEETGLFRPRGSSH